MRRCQRDRVRALPHVCMSGCASARFHARAQAVRAGLRRGWGTARSCAARCCGWTPPTAARRTWTPCSRCTTTATRRCWSACARWTRPYKRARPPSLQQRRRRAEALPARRGRWPAPALPADGDMNCWFWGRSCAPQSPTAWRLPKPSTAWRLPSCCMYIRLLYASRATRRHTSAKLRGQQACPCCHSLHGSLLPDPLLQSGLFTRCAFVAELCPAAARAPRS